MRREKATPPKRTRYLVLWWTSKTPYAAIFENLVSAEAAASVRNALLITIAGEDAEVERVDDWYRRDEEGRPMPAEWRLTIEQVWGSRFSSRLPVPRVDEPSSEPAAEPCEA